MVMNMNRLIYRLGVLSLDYYRILLSNMKIDDMNMFVVISPQIWKSMIK